MEFKATTSVKATSVLGLLDGNDFYVSCERLFRPDLRARPCIVLSNNDGAIVSRSGEAKKLGFKMGQPMFEVRALIEKHNVAVFSSNYALYADVSNRMMETIGQWSPSMSVASIDEAFVNWSGIDNIVEYGLKVRQHVLQNCGIPIGIGLANTPTLSKLANYIAKRHPKSRGVFDYNGLNERQRVSILKNIPTSEVWGIGRRHAAALADIGIQTVLDLRESDTVAMRSRFSLVMEKTIRELRGEACVELSDIASPRKQIVNSRSFGTEVIDSADLESAIAHFVSNAAVKLRKQHSAACMLQVFILTNHFRTDHPQYSGSIALPLVHPTDNTLTLQSAAMSGLESIYRSGFNYKKAGVILSEIVPEGTAQGDLFSVSADPKDKSLMLAMDSLNKRYGRGTVVLSADTAKPAWAMKQERKSPSYTTDWNQLPECS